MHIALARHGLPEPAIQFDQHALEPNRLIREEQALASTTEVTEAEWDKLNADQLVAANAIVDAVKDNEFGLSGLFFLDGPGDTRKTFVQNTVMAKLRSEDAIVLAVASSGIAATLLEGGTTAHFSFKIPLDTTAESTCEIRKGTYRCELLKRVKLIFWDEAPKQRKFDFTAVSRTLSDLCDVAKDVPDVFYASERLTQHHCVQRFHRKLLTKVSSEISHKGFVGNLIPIRMRLVKGLHLSTASLL